MAPNTNSTDYDDYSISSDGREEHGSQATSKESVTLGTTTNNEPLETGGIGNNETKAVLRLRIMVILALFAAAAAVSVAVYLITNKSEESQFNAEFDSSASKVIESFQSVVGLKMSAIVSLSVAATAYARQQNDTWPFVTMNDFQQRAATARGISDSLFLELLPIVTEQNRKKWEEYSMANKGWLAEGRAYQKALGLGYRRLATGDFFNTTEIDFSSGISDKIYTLDKDWKPVRDPGPGPYYPIWQSSPILERDLINYDLRGYPYYAPYFLKCAETGQVSLGGIDVAIPGDGTSPDLQTSFFAFLESFAARRPSSYSGDPMSSVYIPVFDTYEQPRKAVAVILAVINWATYFKGALPPGNQGVDLVLENTCQGPYTYHVNGKGVHYLGKGDLHYNEFNGQVRRAQLKIMDDASHLDLTLNQDLCKYFVRVYPSQPLYEQFHTSTPLLVTFAVASMFMFAVALFVVYDRLVERRQKLVLTSAQKTSAIVSSLFPENVRDRLIENAISMPEGGRGLTTMSGNRRLQSFLSAGTNVDDDGMKPIADLFPNTTVIFSDISGFTAWSSTRDPSQVFILLQTVYQAFDKIANQRKVFKVETIGDSYVAVTGLPNPQEKHALIAARFAWDCLIKFNELVSELEVKLGPDTADLKIRFGIHSGPCTAGVLRGERSRFQLFGDTVNTAARMESTGAPNMIQASSSTAALLVEAKKKHWIKRRANCIEAKGKGLMDTYWIVLGASPAKSTSSSVQIFDELNNNEQDGCILSASDILKRNRMVDWITDLLLTHIKKIVAKRKAMSTRQELSTSLVYFPAKGTTCLDEVEDVITMPQFDSSTAHFTMDIRTIEISSDIVSQLRELVGIIASTYRNNPFHNFEHACHVTMSVDKLLTRVVTPDLDDEINNHDMASQLHNYTHGINSDPLTWFAIIFAALIHDSDHRGVSNVQLMKEEEQMAALYKNKSVAEQNSLDIAWEVFMGEQFEQLRSCIFANRNELLRFRQLIVNVVLATDIFDKELNDLRKARWNKAFAEKDEQDNNLRATIVIEHMIQASDVAHTMQHWHIYRKWNERLFTEMYTAFKAGRMGTDPSTFWYKGEIGFFDNYIIPLAMKLKDCNVFGVSSDEYLNYAKQNRDEWAHKGEQIVAEMVEKYGRETTKDI